jgi:hypothetical protein
MVPILLVKPPSTTQPLGHFANACSTFEHNSSFVDCSQPGFQKSVSSEMNGSPRMSASCLPSVLWIHRETDSILGLHSNSSKYFPCPLLPDSKDNPFDGYLYLNNGLTTVPNDVNSVVAVRITD